ncbi:MAG: hypothetical protein K9I47_07890 [Bacteroidales bacterium]|nr:hypothetical protein [Bacteroidales bacterium]
MINGTLDDNSVNEIHDQILLIQFKKIDKMPEDKKSLLKEFLNLFRPAVKGFLNITKSNSVGFIIIDRFV